MQHIIYRDLKKKQQLLDIETMLSNFQISLIWTLKKIEKKTSGRNIQRQLLSIAQKGRKALSSGRSCTQVEKLQIKRKKKNIIYVYQGNRYTFLKMNNCHFVTVKVTVYLPPAKMTANKLHTFKLQREAPSRILIFTIKLLGMKKHKNIWKCTDSRKSYDL